MRRLITAAIWAVFLCPLSAGASEDCLSYDELKRAYRVTSILDTKPWHLVGAEAIRYLAWVNRQPPVTEYEADELLIVMKVGLPVATIHFFNEGKACVSHIIRHGMHMSALKASKQQAIKPDVSVYPQGR